MMIKESLIEKYFENTLSAEERKAFNTFLETDVDFRNDVAFQKELKETLVLSERESLKQELQDLESGSSKRKFNIWPIAASIVLLLGISSFWFFSNQDINSETLFNSHFEPYRNIVEPIVRGDTSESIKVKAFSAYEQKDYEASLIYFNTLLKQESNSTLRFYKANILLQLDKGKEAAEIFKENLKDSDSLIEKNQWYLALSYLKLNQFDLAKKQLQDLIRNPESEYKKKEAQFLFKKLD